MQLFSADAKTFKKDLWLFVFFFCSPDCPKRPKNEFSYWKCVSRHICSLICVSTSLKYNTSCETVRKSWKIVWFLLKEWRKFYEKNVTLKLDESYSLHLWGKHSSHIGLSSIKDTLLYNLGLKHCPFTMKMLK